MRDRIRCIGHIRHAHAGLRRARIPRGGHNRITPRGEAGSLPMRGTAALASKAAFRNCPTQENAARGAPGLNQI